MPIRPATINDLPVISSIYADGFWDEEFIGHTINPHRQEHSQDYLDFWKRRVLESYWDYSHKLMVFYLDGEEDAGEEGEKEVVVGAADWHRLGQGWEKVWAVKGWWDIRKDSSVSTFLLFDPKVLITSMGNMGNLSQGT